jgi:CHAT domain-containing protein
MKRFYRYLARGFSKAEALQKAQIHVKNVIQGHPAAWAAFTLTGDYR